MQCLNFFFADHVMYTSMILVPVFLEKVLLAPAVVPGACVGDGSFDPGSFSSLDFGGHVRHFQDIRFHTTC